MAKLPEGVFYHRDDFIIDGQKQARIDEAMATARAKPRRVFEPALEAVHQSEHATFMSEAEQVRLPFDYRLAISFEEKAAKPRWFKRAPMYDRVCHITLSIDGKTGCLAPPAALAKVMRACRHVDDSPDRVWVQDFESLGGLMGYAVHAVWLDA